MNKLSCLEHLSTLSLSTEMSEMMLRREKAQQNTEIVTEAHISHSGRLVRLSFKSSTTEARQCTQTQNYHIPTDMP